MTSFVSHFVEWAVGKLTGAYHRKQRQKKVTELRRKRRNILEKWCDVGIGPPVCSGRQIEVLVDMALQEARLRPDFNPDLLIVTEAQYKSMFDIPAAVSVNPDDWHHHYLEAGRIKNRTLPPSRYRVDAGEIDVVYSSSADGMLLVESERL